MQTPDPKMAPTSLPHFAICILHFSICNLLNLVAHLTTRRSLLSTASACLLLSPLTLRAAEYPPDLVARTEPLSAQEQQKKFRLPPGFSIELVVSEPDIAKPMNLNFDPAGRLYVSNSLEYPFPAKSNPRDSIKVIDDTNGDGKLDRVRTFVDGLNIPIGVIPVSDGVIGFSIPNIYKFRDTDGDGIADKRDILISGFEFRDTHGMASSFTLGLDGWIYSCHGFANRSRMKGTDGSTLELQSGNTFRFRPDGSHIEQFTHGQVNPFGLTFDELGNLYSSDCHSKPIYLLLRNAYYPSFGKPHDGLGYGPEMMSHAHGSTGICGVSYYGADNFPPEYRGTLFVCNPVTGRVNHDWLAAYGSSYRAIERPDFLTCDDPWFRPVDSKVGPDGALYIADFYNRIIGHYEVPLTHPQRDRTRGRIWRIVYDGPAGRRHVPGPDLTRQSISELITSLNHPNLTIRNLATQQLKRKLSTSSSELTDLATKLTGTSITARQRLHLASVLAELNELNDLRRLDVLASDPDRLVRNRTAQILARHPLWKSDVSAMERLAAKLLDDNDPFVRRTAAEVLGGHPQPSHLSPLLDLWKRTPPEDLELIHVVRMALRDNLAATKNIADAVKNYPSADLDRLIEIALGIPTAKAADWIISSLLKRSAETTLPGDATRFLMRHASDESLPDLYKRVEQEIARAKPTRAALVLSSLARGARERGIQPLERFRARALELAGSLLQAKDIPTVQGGIDLARDARLIETLPRLEELLCNPAFEYAPLKRMAVDLLVELDPSHSLTILTKRVNDSREELRVRIKSAEGLGNINTLSARRELVEAFRTAPEEVALGIARALVLGKDGAVALMDAVAAGKTSPHHLKDLMVAARIRGFQIKDLEQRMDELTRDLPPDDERVLKLLARRRDAFLKGKWNPADGAKVFAKTCAACHKVGGTGGKVGPELDGIGQRGLARILEDTLNPNRNVDQAFRSTTLSLKSGRVLSGLVLRTEGAALVLADEQGKEIRIPEDEIEEKTILPISPMPANIAEQLPERDFCNLIAHLLSQQPRAIPPKR